MADSVVHEEPSVVGGGGLGRDGSHHAAGDALGLGGGETGLGFGDGGDGGLDDSLDLSFGQPLLGLGHLRHRRADCLLHVGGSESRLRFRRRSRIGQL